MKKILLTLICLFLPLFSVFAQNTEIIQGDLQLRQAFAASISGDHKLAVDLYSGYLEKFPDDQYVRGEYSRSLFLTGKNEQSQIEAKKAYESGPNGEIASLYGEILMKNGKFSEAEKAVLSISGQYNNNPHMDFQLASIYEKMNLKDKEEFACRQVLLRLHEAGWKASIYKNVCLWRLVKIYISKKDYEQAKPLLLRYMEGNPESAFGRFLLAYLIYFNRGDYLRAEREFEKLFKIPADVLEQNRVNVSEAARAYGEILYFRGSPGCRRFFNMAVEKSQVDEYLIGMKSACSGQLAKSAKILFPLYKSEDPPPASVKAVLKLIESENKPDLYAYELLRNSVHFERKGFLEQSEYFAKKLLDVKINNPEISLKSEDIYLRLALINEEARNFNTAVYYMRKALKKTSDSEDEKIQKRKLMLVRYLSHPDVGRYAEGEKILNEMKVLSQEKNDFYYTRGLNSYRLSRYGEAVKYFTKAIDAKEEPFYYFFRALAYHELDDFENTRKDLTKVLSFGKPFPEASNFLGYLYAEKNLDLNESRKLILTAVEASPLDGGYHDSLGWVYYKIGDYERARYHTELAVLLLEEKKNEDPVVYDHLGDIWLKLNDPALALNSYRRALSNLRKKMNQNESSSRLLRERKNLLESLEKKIKKITKPR